ncbi:MAG: helix-turn-helix domain-containing protein [Planctomycetes bacterium]|nr:helix-turn-helix domain-containing protein [Planctomycetota bacterium]
MRTAGRKDVLTTGEVARICRVAPRTVSKWFDTGKLRGYRIPGSRDRRIPRRQLLAFMRAHGIPLDGLDGGRCRVMVLSRGLPDDTVSAVGQSDRYELRVASNGFEAGMIAQDFRPHVVVVEAAENEQDAVAVCRLIKNAEELAGSAVLIVAADLDESRRRHLMGLGFDGCIARPLTASKLLAAVEEATNLIR